MNMGDKDFLRYAKLIKQDYAHSPFLAFEHRALLVHGSDDVQILYTKGELILLFRGTENFMEELERQNKIVGYAMAFREWWWNIMTCPEEWMGTRVHKGFAKNIEPLMKKVMDTDLWKKFMEERAETIAYNKRVSSRKALPKFTLVGHSRGGALAILSAMMLVYMYGLSPSCIITYGSPRVGGKKFKKRFEEMGLTGYRIVNRWDPVVCLPPPFRFRHVLEKRWAHWFTWPISQGTHRIESYIEGLQKRVDVV